MKQARSFVIHIKGQLENKTYNYEEGFKKMMSLLQDNHMISRSILDSSTNTVFITLEVVA